MQTLSISCSQEGREYRGYKVIKWKMGVKSQSGNSFYLITKKSYDSLYFLHLKKYCKTT